MEIIAKAEERRLLLRLQGELDHHGARQAMLQIDRAIEAAVPLTTLLDMQAVSFMDSSGLAVLLRAQRRMESAGGRLKVVNVPPQAKKVLDAAGMSRYIHIE